MKSYKLIIIIFIILIIGVSVGYAGYGLVESITKIEDPTERGLKSIALSIIGHAFLTMGKNQAT